MSVLPSPLLTKASLKKLVKGLKLRQKKIVFTNGCFDVLHSGHVHLLNKARSFGDVLIVGLNSDTSVRKLKGKGRPVNKLRDRAFLLRMLRCVDGVIAFSDETPIRVIRNVVPDVHVKGGDYRPSSLPEGDLVRSLGGRVKIIPLKKGYSTSRVLSHMKKRK